MSVHDPRAARPRLRHASRPSDLTYHLAYLAYLLGFGLMLAAFLLLAVLA